MDFTYSHYTNSVPITDQTCQSTWTCHNRRGKSYYEKLCKLALWKMTPPSLVNFSGTLPFWTVEKLFIRLEQPKTESAMYEFTMGFKSMVHVWSFHFWSFSKRLQSEQNVLYPNAIWNWTWGHLNQSSNNLLHVQLNYQRSCQETFHSLWVAARSCAKKLEFLHKIFKRWGYFKSHS